MEPDEIGRLIQLAIVIFASIGFGWIFGSDRSHKKVSEQESHIKDLEEQLTIAYRNKP